MSTISKYHSYDIALIILHQHSQIDCINFLESFYALGHNLPRRRKKRIKNFLEGLKKKNQFKLVQIKLLFPAVVRVCLALTNGATQIIDCHKQTSLQNFILLFLFIRLLIISISHEPLISPLIFHFADHFNYSFLISIKINF